MFAATLAVATSFVSVPAHAGGPTTQQGQFQHGLSGKVLDSPAAAQFKFEAAHVFRSLNEPMVDPTVQKYWTEGKTVQIALMNRVVLPNGQFQTVDMKTVGQYMDNIKQNLKDLHDANMPVQVIVFPQINHSGFSGPDFLAVYNSIRKVQTDLGVTQNLKLGVAMNVEAPGEAPLVRQSASLVHETDPSASLQGNGRLPEVCLPGCSSVYHACLYCQQCG